MSIRAYLPSTQFVVIVGSLLVSGGLVAGAQLLTHQPPTTLVVTAEPHTDDNWQDILAAIQAQSGVTLPETPGSQTVGSILASAQTPSLTETVARSLLITLTDAKARGLGDDIPTQDQLVAQALAQAASTTINMYSSADLSVIAASADSQHTYGNTVMRTFAARPGANSSVVLAVMGYAVDYSDTTQLGALTSAQIEYRALARELAAVPVPQTLAPLHLQLVNDIAAMGAAVADMRTVVGDPLRGLAGLQKFNSKSDEALRVLTTIAGILGKNGILFNKDEPGATWELVLSSP